MTRTPPDFPENEDVPRTRNYRPAAQSNFVEIPELISGYIYYFDVAPNSKRPDVMIYIPTRHIGPDDLSVTQGLVHRLQAHGRSEHCDNYLNLLEGLAEHRRLDEGKGLQTYIGLMVKKNGDLDITSCLGAEAFDPARAGGAKKLAGSRRAAVGFADYRSVLM